MQLFVTRSPQAREENCRAGIVEVREELTLSPSISRVADVLEKPVTCVPHMAMGDVLDPCLLCQDEVDVGVPSLTDSSLVFVHPYMQTRVHGKNV